MKYNICAPDKFNGSTCFSPEQIREMAAAYNRYITKNNLNPNSTPFKISLINITSDTEALLRELMDRFDVVCGDNQICLTKQLFMDEIVREMNEDILYNTFRVGGPDKSTEWLSTTDIDGIMKQYERIYPEFIFMGAVPRDCSKVSFCSLFSTDFNNFMKKDKTKIGIIFNQDSFGQPGSHWVAMYLNLEKGQCYYCDSIGQAPLKEVEEYIDLFSNFYKEKNGKKPTYKYNDKSYQKDNSECGVYSCNFLIRLLRGQSFNDIIENSLDFKQINSCRNLYFSNAPSKYKPHALCDPS